MKRKLKLAAQLAKPVLQRLQNQRAQSQLGPSQLESGQLHVSTSHLVAVLVLVSPGESVLLPRRQQERRLPLMLQLLLHPLPMLQPRLPLPRKKLLLYLARLEVMYHLTSVKVLEPQLPDQLLLQPPVELPISMCLVTCAKVVLRPLLDLQHLVRGLRNPSQAVADGFLPTSVRNSNDINPSYVCHEVHLKPIGDCFVSPCFSLFLSFCRKVRFFSLCYVTMSCHVHSRIISLVLGI